MRIFANFHTLVAPANAGAYARDVALVGPGFRRGDELEVIACA
jgi:hypothetical protein